MIDGALEQITAYFDKIRNLDVLYCESHDLEFLEGEECSDCEREQLDFEQSMKAKSDYNNRNGKKWEGEKT